MFIDHSVYNLVIKFTKYNWEVIPIFKCHISILSEL